MIAVRPLTVAIGTYAGGGGRGLQMLERDAAVRWSLGAVYPDAANASYGVYSDRFDLYYLVDERDDGAVGVHRHDADGWHRLALVPVDGDAPCHIALNRAQTQVAVANYASGSVSLLTLDPATGLPVAPAQVRANRGSGPNRERQASSHMHWVGFSSDDRWLYAADLGTDKVLAYPVDASGTLGEATIAYVAPPGSGPRQLAFHPHLAGIGYLVSELTNMLTMLAIEGATMTARATLSTLPAGYDGDSILAQIAIDAAGARLYVSNRGHDSIAVFALDATGMPTALDHAPTGGRSPRHFCLFEDERLIAVAHERDQTVTILPMGADGMPTPSIHSVPIPGAAFVLPRGSARA